MTFYLKLELAVQSSIWSFAEPPSHQSLAHSLKHQKTHITTMFSEFETFSVKTQSEPPVTIHGIKSGDASSTRPPLLLLHGFPQTHHIWHRVAPQLTDKYTVVAMDLRGYGQSSKPADIASYAKSAMARDCVAVMDALGFDSFFVCAHDRGARVAHKLAVDHPTRIRKTILLDICPTLAMYTATNFEFAKAYFHWFFLIQPEPLPEMLIAPKGREVAHAFMGSRTEGVEIFDPACFEAYVKSLEDPVTVHAMCNDYRASASLDLDEAREDIRNGTLIQSPLLILWGKQGVVEKCFDAVKEWRAVTKDGVPVNGYSVESGHYIPEQAPADVISAISGFFV